MGFFDDKLTEKQKRIIRFSYELCISIMLVLALKYSNMAFDEGQHLCLEAQQEWGSQFGLDNITFDGVPEMNEHPFNITNVTVDCCPC